MTVLNSSASESAEPDAAQALPPWRREPLRLSLRASPRRYDWPRAAKLLAAGTPAGEVAEALGCDEARVWRHLKASAIFRGMVEKEAERNRLLHGLRMQALRRSHAEALLTRADLAPEAIERLVAALPEVTGAQLAAAARRPTAPNRKAAARLENERQNSLALLSANQIMRDVAAARREFRAAMAPASPSPMPVTKTPECPGSPAKPRETDAKPGDADTKPGAAGTKPPQVVPEGCEALYYHGLFVPILPEYWGQEMGPGWSLTPDALIPGEP